MGLLMLMVIGQRFTLYLEILEFPITSRVNFRQVCFVKPVQV